MNAMCFRRILSAGMDKVSTSRALRRGRFLAALLLAGCGLAGSAAGADGVWTNRTGGNWSDVNKWSGGVVADGAGAIALFTNNITAAAAVTLDGAVASRTLGVLSLGDAASTYYAFNISPSGGGTLTFNNNGAESQLNQLSNAAAQAISVPLILNGSLRVNNGSATTLTLSGSLRGSGNLVLSSALAGAITLSGEANPTGTIENVGVGLGVATLSGGVGTNVTTIIENSTNSALTISTKALAVSPAGTLLVNSNAAGVRVLTLSGPTTATGDLTLRNDSSIALGITFSGAGGHTGQVFNTGSGTGSVSVSGALGLGVTKVVQESPSSMLILGGANTMTGRVVIRTGVVRGNVAAAFGAAASRIFLGDTAGESDAVLMGGAAVTHANPITVVGGNTGVASITPAANAVFSGPVTLDSHNLVLSNAANTLTLSGGLAGTGNVIVATGAGAITLSTAEANPVGTIENIGRGVGVLTLSGGVGTNVTTIIENSTNSALTVSTKPLVVSPAGTLLVNSNAAGVRVLTLSAPTTATGDLTLRNDSSIALGITFSGAGGHTGQVFNTGSGTGSVSISGALGLGVTKVVQESPSSMLILGGINTMTGAVVIRTGVVRGNVAAAFGAAASRIFLGDTAGAADAVLMGGAAVTHANPITVVGGNTGVASITPAANAIFSGLVTLEGHDLVLSNAASTLTLSGGLSGTGNVIVAAGAGAITLSTAEANHAGIIANVGNGVGVLTLSGGVGSNVTAIIENSTNSALTISTKDLVVGGAGALLVNSNAAGVRVLTLSAGTAGAGDLTLRNESAIASGITISGMPNHTGRVVNAGAGAGSVTLSGGVGSNVTAFIQGSAVSTLRAITKDLVVNSNGTEVINDGGALFTFSPGTAGAGDLVLRNNSATTNGLTVSVRGLNHAGRVVNSGTGTGHTLVSSVIGTGVTAVSQESDTSVLILGAANTFTSGLAVAGNTTVRIANSTGSATGPGPVAIEPGGTLDGSGIMAGLVTLAAGGTLSPAINDRTAAGKIRIGDLTWHGGGALDCVVTRLEGALPGTNYSQVAVDRNLTILPNGTNLVIRVDTLGQTLSVNPGLNYGLKLIECKTAGMATNLDLSFIDLDTNAFLVDGGTWVLTNMLNGVYLLCENVPQSAARNVWVALDPNTGGYGYWGDTNNWSLGHSPLPGEDVVFDYNSTVICWMRGATNEVGSLTVTENYGSTLIFYSGFPGQGFYQGITVTGDVAIRSGVLKHLPHLNGDNTAVNRLVLTVGGDFLMTSNVLVYLDGLGYAANYGPGAGVSGTAASRRSACHGGAGAFNATNAMTYGSATWPEALGSGANGAGGGALLLQVAGTATLDGTVTAQGVGGTATACPGAGGSICIKAGTIAGNGVLRAGVDTSTPAYYGSGGGRIAVIATNGGSPAGLTCRANPHDAALNGGGRAGTVYLETPSFKRLIIDQENIGAASTNYTVLPSATEAFAVDPAFGGPLEDVTLVMTNGAFVSLSRDLRLGDIERLEGELALRSHTLYLKAAPPAGSFPADYGNGTVTLPGVFHRFENGDTLVRDGRLLWDDPEVSWRLATLVYQDEGGTATNTGFANEGYFTNGSALALEALPLPDWPFRFWDGTIPAGADRYDNPLAVPLTNNAALRAWFRTNIVDLSHNRWIPASVSDDWFLPYNWDLLMVPVTGQTVTIPTGSIVRLSAASPPLAAFTIETNAVLTFEGWNSALEATNILVEGTLTHRVQARDATNALGEWIPQHRLWVKATNLTVAATGALNADNVGYPPGAGPGRAPAQYGTGGEGMGYGTGGGGGYGGKGAAVYSQMYGMPYGEPADPWQPGSGGAYRPLQSGYGTRPGGGAIRVDVAEQLTLNGAISARGQNAAVGSSGSGGGIAIYCRTFQGATSGWVRADGGTCAAKEGGSGGGGRIALHYDPAAQAALPDPRPPIRFSASSGQPGILTTILPVMGSLYLPDTLLLSASSNGPVLLDDQRFWHVRLHVGSQPASWSPASLTLSNCVVGFPEGYALTVAGNLTLSGTKTPVSGTDKAGLHFTAAQNDAFYGSLLTVGGRFEIGQDCWFYPHTEGFTPSIVGVHVRGDFSVAAGGGINADREGYMPDRANTNGPGAPLAGWAGGSYGGLGGYSNATLMVTNGIPRETYGRADMPLELGSPGGWRNYGNYTGTGRGGGAIHVLSDGRMTIDGLLTANGGNGTNYYGNGGSGGSIFLAGRRLEGGATGTLSARGGHGHVDGNPGGGGRVAVWQAVLVNRAQERIAGLDTTGLVPLETLQDFGGLIDVQEGGTGVGAGPGTVSFLTYRNYTFILIR